MGEIYEEKYKQIRKIITILLFIIIIIVGIYFNYEKENKTNNVLYRVTPYFEGNNELANGITIEAYSIEDNGKLHFNIYVHNIQYGIVLDYATGESKLEK